MLSHFTSILIQFIASRSYLAIFILMTLESALLPIPSEVTMPFGGFLAQSGQLSLIVVILLGAIGNVVGSLIAYVIGYYLEETVILKLIRKYGKYILLREHEYERALKWFDKYGYRVVFFSRLLPGVRTFVSLPAGLSKMNLMKFSLYTFLGSLIWSALLAYIGFYLGKNWENIHGVFNNLHYIVAVAVIGLIGWYIYKHMKRNTSKKIRN